VHVNAELDEGASDLQSIGQFSQQAILPEMLFRNFRSPAPDIAAGYSLPTNKRHVHSSYAANMDLVAPEGYAEFPWVY
jgi:hypothetical protein